MVNAIPAAVELIKKARHAVAFSGAGISTASGIPDFRSPESGLWERYSPGEVASYQAFKQTPSHFYDWIRPLFLRAQEAEPNPAHRSLAALQDMGYLQEIITQNIDGLQQKAGAKDVIELHGSASTATCPNCRTQYSTDEIMALYIQKQSIPHCSLCRSVIKPDVVLFDELLPENAWHEANTAVEKADLVIVVGSSLSVYPANMLPAAAHRNGAKIIINSLAPTENDGIADVLLREGCEFVLPQIVAILES